MQEQEGKTVTLCSMVQFILLMFLDFISAHSNGHIGPKKFLFLLPETFNSKDFCEAPYQPACLFHLADKLWSNLFFLMFSDPIFSYPKGFCSFLGSSKNGITNGSFFPNTKKYLKAKNI